MMSQVNEELPTVVPEVEEQLSLKIGFKRVLAAGALLVLCGVAMMTAPGSFSSSASVTDLKKVDIEKAKNANMFFFTKVDQKAFDAMDTNHDKKISIDEYNNVKKYAKDATAKRVVSSIPFEDMDMNGDEEIDFQEFQTYIEASKDSTLLDLVRGDTEKPTSEQLEKITKKYNL